MVKRWAIAVPAAALFVWSAAVALKVGRADSIVYEASREMATWTASGANPGDDTWTWVRDDLERAERAIPQSAVVHEALGVLDAKRNDYLDDALEEYRAALSFRPTSPYTWSNLGALLYRRGDTGQLFETALRRSAELGPAEPEVQDTVADLGLAVWDQVGPETREAVEAMLKAGLARNTPVMLQIAARRGRLAFACRHLIDLPRPGDDRWKTTCKSTEARS